MTLGTSSGPMSGIAMPVVNASIRAAQIGLVYWPRLPTRLTVTMTESQTWRAGPRRNRSAATARIRARQPM